jgi:hypothetical protein
MARQAQIIGSATDIDGDQWDVRERRPTKHGWPLEIGWPERDQRGRGGRGVAVIITPQLARYLAETRRKDIDLPIGITTIKRIRYDLGLRWSWDEWWTARKEDLLALTLEQFCAKHGCSIGAASQRRRQFRRPD